MPGFRLSKDNTVRSVSTEPVSIGAKVIISSQLSSSTGSVYSLRAYITVCPSFLSVILTSISAKVCVIFSGVQLICIFPHRTTAAVTAVVVATSAFASAAGKEVFFLFVGENGLNISSLSS